MNSIFSKITRRFELNRIAGINRYEAGSSTLIGKRIDFVDSSTFLHGYQEIFREEVYRFRSNRNSPLIIDCGSNIGLSIIYFKTLFPESRIIGFEPDTEIFKVLERNVKSFGFGNVELHNAAVWKKEEILKFRSEGGFSGRIVVNNDIPTYEVKAVQLNPFLGPHEVDFLKLDIEGAEIDVIQSIEENLSQINNIFIEYHSPKDTSQNLSTLLQILERNSFRYYLHEAYVPPNPFLEIKNLDGMDLQLNISCIKN